MLGITPSGILPEANFKILVKPVQRHLKIDLGAYKSPKIDPESKILVINTVKVSQSRLNPIEKS